MRKLQQLWGRLRRGVRRRWEDWRTGTLTCWGGPLDGQRLIGCIECYTVSIDNTPWCAFDAWDLSQMVAVSPKYEPIGHYANVDGAFEWEQYARNEVTRPPDHPYPGPESWS